MPCLYNYQERLCQTSCECAGVAREVIRINVYTMICIFRAIEDFWLAHSNAHGTGMKR